MKYLEQKRRERLKDRGGFVLPTVVFALVIMAVVTVASLVGAGDEMTSSRAMHEASSAFYAAEAGLHEVFARWTDTDSVLDLVPPGGKLELEWRALEGGSRYRATIHRWDNGGQPMFILSVGGRGPGLMSGQRTLSFALTSNPLGLGIGYELGNCCKAAVTMRGDAQVEQLAGVSGFDEKPAGWGDECKPDTADRPGIIIKDESELDFETGGYAEGVPADVIEDPAMDESYFDDFGGLSWDSIRAMADHVIGDHPTEKEIHSGKTGPSYNADGSCNTDDPMNWGSPDPNDPCYDHFPIILVTDEVFLHGDTYAQGIFILDWDESQPWGMKGTEFDLEDNSVFNGVILGKGCVEVEDQASFHGGMFLDGYYRDERVCFGDHDFAMNDGAARMHFSQCAVDRAIYNSGLGKHATVNTLGDGNRPVLIGERAFGELVR
jgi:hypothetical protein